MFSHGFLFIYVPITLWSSVVKTKKGPWSQSLIVEVNETEDTQRMEAECPEHYAT